MSTKMSRSLFSLVLLLACAHALTHLLEFALPATEQLISESYHVDKDVSGQLGMVYRLPLGLFALATGWLVDRYGSRRMLLLFLFGSAVLCVVTGLAIPLSGMFIVMFLMGTFTAIYHPAGLALISHRTTPSNRSAALGLHGIFGSLGIGAAPFVAGSVFALGFDWRQYYWFLAIPCVVLGGVFLWRLPGDPISRDDLDANPVDENIEPIDPREDHTDWRSFFTLMCVAVLFGIIYSAVLHFLTRYLRNADIYSGWFDAKSAGSFIAAGVLLIGCFSQGYAGVWAKPHLLERQLTLVVALTIPCLLFMAAAQGWYRILAAALFSLVYFTHQPIYNSLIAKYTPRHRRSLCYGIGFTLSLGVGSIGSALAGLSENNLLVYGSLAVVAGMAGLCDLMLCIWNPPQRGE